MFWFVMGLPTQFTAWCRTVVAQCSASAPPLEIAAETLEQLALAILRAGTSRALISSLQPAGSLRDVLAAANRPYLVALGDPRTALIELVLGQGVALNEAVQIVAGSCAAFAGKVEAPGALVLDPARDMSDPVATAAVIAMHFGFQPGETELVRLASLYAGDLAPQEDAARWWNGLDATEQKIVTGALTAFAEPGPAHGALSITWHHDLFFHGDRPGERVSGPVDITGRAHCLIEGPHILLPPGTWALSLGLSFTREAAEREFLVEVCSPHPLASGPIRPMDEGPSVAHLEFVVDAGAQHPVDIRVSSLRAAFDGTISVDAATLVRLPTAPPTAP